MKKMILLLMAVIMSCSMSASKGTKTSENASLIPTNIVVKQTVGLKNGKDIVVFYEKNGNIVKVYSMDDELGSYTSNDAKTIKTTSFEIVSKNDIKGKLFGTYKVKDLISFMKTLIAKV